MSTNVELRISLDEELAHTAERCAADCGFASVQELIVFLLQGALRLDNQEMDARELEIVEERLRDLGYF